MTVHAIIPDCQVKDGVDLSYLTWVGKYLVEKQPDVIVQIGDFADMPSLSSYDVGKKSFEGRRYKTDIEVTNKAMQMLLAPIKEYNERARRNKDRQYRPRMVLTLGNHEERISRAVEGDPKLDGTISLSDLKYEHYGWEVASYLEPVVIDGVVYAHYFTSGVMGRPVMLAWGLDPWSCNVIKYVQRHRKKNGKEDLEKAKHYLEFMIENYDAVGDKYYKD